MPRIHTPIEILVQQLSKTPYGELEGLLRRTFAAGEEGGIQKGLKLGAQRERRRMAAYLDEADGNDAPDVDERPVEPPPIVSRSYGSITGPVRDALRDRATSGKTVTAETVTAWLKNRVATEAIEIGQVRSALKALERGGEAVRVERGHYTAGPNLKAIEVSGHDVENSTETQEGAAVVMRRLAL